MLMILILASILRLWGLGQNPVSLYWEEAALGYDAYSIWKTGMDHHGNPWPVVAFVSFGDYKPSGYFYAAAPIVGILGLTEVAVRLPSALAGIGAVALIYILGCQLFSRRLGLMTAFLLAITPWHIHLSRAAFEANLAITLMLAGVVLWIEANKSRRWLFIPAAVLLAASMYTYHSMRLFTPVIVVGLAAWAGIRLLRSGWAWVGGVLFVFLLLPILINIRNPEVSKRFQETSFFAYSQAVVRTNQLRQQYGDSLLARVIIHRYWFWGGEIMSRMGSHFRPDFLFWSGDGNLRHQTGRWGLLYPWMAIPLLAGLAGIIDKKTRKLTLFLVLWLVAASLPSALTIDAPHTLRFLPAVPAFILLTGVGSVNIYDRFGARKIAAAGALIVAGLFLVAYGFDYLKEYPTRSQREWQYGYKQLVEYTSKLPQDKPISITRHYGRPAMYFMFYEQVDPESIQKQASGLPKDQGELLAVGSYIFGDDVAPDSGFKITNQGNDGRQPVKIIKDLSGEPVFYVYNGQDI